jgi:hypothetical protein
MQFNRVRNPQHECIRNLYSYVYAVKIVLKACIRLANEREHVFYYNNIYILENLIPLPTDLVKIIMDFSVVTKRNNGIITFDDAEKQLLKLFNLVQQRIKNIIPLYGKKLTYELQESARKIRLSNRRNRCKILTIDALNYICEIKCPIQKSAIECEKMYESLLSKHEPYEKHFQHFSRKVKRQPDTCINM